MSVPIRVFLADDQHLVRAGFRMLLESQPDLQVVGEAADGADAVRQLARTAADVVLMDVRMPVLDGIAATRQIRDAAQLGDGAAGTDGDRPRVLVLTTFDLDEYAFAAIRAGASGFLLKDAPPEDLLAAVRTVHAGDAVVAPSTTRRLLSHLAAIPEQPAPPSGAGDPRLAPLTDREREVLEQVATGRSNAEIAVELTVSELTVKTHVGRVLTKLELRDRTQAAVFAHRERLVLPD